jgi:hypothetical protein
MTTVFSEPTPSGPIADYLGLIDRVGIASARRAEAIAGGAPSLGRVALLEEVEHNLNTRIDEIGSMPDVQEFFVGSMQAAQDTLEDLNEFADLLDPERIEQSRKDAENKIAFV